MSYTKLLKMVANEHNTTPENVDEEMRRVIQSAGYDMEPESFVALMAAKVKKRTNKTNTTILPYDI
ncbi:MAG: hypothetical protein IJU96_03055 [Clostridia bacterium]|nr:hypothetical protein [Clostridia bacterium]